MASPPAAHRWAVSPSAVNLWAAPTPTGRAPTGRAGTGRAAPRYGQGGGASSAYANYQQVQKKKSPIGWWITGAALLVVIVVVAVIAIRAVTGADTPLTNPGGGQASQDVCPQQKTVTAAPAPTNDGRVHGGPVSYPLLGSPWEAPARRTGSRSVSTPVTQTVTVEPNYAPNSHWVASVLVAELQAGDGFFTPEQGSQIVVKCILGAFYGNSPVTSEVKKNEKATIDGREAWIVESQLSFDIPNLRTKGELLIVAIVSAGNRSGIFYASIPDTTPDSSSRHGTRCRRSRSTAERITWTGSRSSSSSAVSSQPGRGRPSSPPPELRSR